MTRIAILFILAVSLLAALGVVLADHVNFSGTWALDKSATPAQFKEVTLVVTVEGILVTVVNKFVLADGTSRESQSTYKTDGQPESTATTGAMAGSLTQKASYSDGGKTLVIEQDRTIKRDAGDVKLHIVNVWSLSADGRTLTIDTSTTQEGGSGTRKSKQVFTKK